MALPNAFANVTALLTPELDENFEAVAALGVIPCTAVGTDTILLTPVANTPTITAYTNTAPVFGFKAAATNTGAVTLSVSGVGGKNVYKANGATALVAGDFIVGRLYFVSFNSSLNSGAGGWVVTNPGATAATAGAVQGAHKNLTVTNVGTGTPDEQVTVTADSISASDGASGFTTLLGVSVTASNIVSGVNGLDTGSVATSTWYAVYVIYNPTTLVTAALLSTNFSVPTLPTGYTQYARVGAMVTDASSDFMDILQKDTWAQYVIGATGNTIIAPVIANGAVGTVSVTSPVLVAASISAFVPPTASLINIATAPKWKGGSLAGVLVAPNTSWGGTNRGPEGSVGQIWPLSQPTNGGISAWMVLESTAVAWASSAAGGAIACLGWKDNL